MNLVLIGFMGSGKSEVGSRLAAVLGMGLADTDARIEERAGISIAHIFEREGEDVFRALERQVVADAAAGDGLVIATGGGVVLDRRNVDALRDNGLIFYLDIEGEDAHIRTAGDAARPLLNVGDREGEVRRLLEQRRPLYEASAHYRIRVSGKSVEELVQEIVEIWRR